MVPFSSDGETEQLQRAELLSAQNVSVLVPESELSAIRLAEGIDEAMERPAPENIAVDTNGAKNSAIIIERIKREQR